MDHSDDICYKGIAEWSLPEDDGLRRQECVVLVGPNMLRSLISKIIGPIHTFSFILLCHSMENEKRMQSQSLIVDSHDSLSSDEVYHGRSFWDIEWLEEHQFSLTIRIRWHRCGFVSRYCHRRCFPRTTIDPVENYISMHASCRRNKIRDIIQYIPGIDLHRWFALLCSLERKQRRWKRDGKEWVVTVFIVDSIMFSPMKTIRH